MRRFLAAAAVVAFVLLARAGPAAAHAELEGTDPPDGAQLEAAPATVTLGFTEGTPVDAGPARHPDGERSRVVVDLPELGDGLYVVSWRVTSSDSHPIQGAFTFAVGDAQGDPAAALAAAGDATAEGSPATGLAFGIVRFLAFAALVLVVGGGAFVVVLAPETPRRPLWIALAVLAAATVVGIGVQGAYTAGTGLGDAVDPDVVGDVLDTQFGRMWLARLVVCAAAVPLLAALRDVRRSPLLVSGATAVALGLLLTTALSGHAGAGDAVPVAVAADVVHVAAGAWWLAGLALLSLFVLRRGDPEEAAPVADRFSRTAVVAVVLIVLTGAFQSWRQVRSIDALDTDYGRLLLAKVTAVAAVLLVAAFSRAAVRRRLPVSRLRRAVAAETLIGVVVIGITAALVNAPPARSAAGADAPAGVFVAERHTATLAVAVRVDPARPGVNQVEVVVEDHFGTTLDPPEVTARLERDGDETVGPIDLALVRTAPGRWSTQAVVPFAGEWVLDVTVRTTEIDIERTAFDLTVR